MAGISKRPKVLLSASEDLFASFFTRLHRQRLNGLFRWSVDHSCVLTSDFQAALASVDALITTWDSPTLDDSLPEIAPRLRIIAHCGGAVKGKFAKQSFDSLVIVNAPEPMSQATAEMGAALLLYCARNIDGYRTELRHSNNIYSKVHAEGALGETLLNRDVSMIGFGRIGRALVELLSAFAIRWTVYDPHADRSLATRYPVRFAPLRTVLRHGHLLVITAALTAETRHLLNAASLALLPDGSAIVNIARGGIIDLAALTREVSSGRLRCALDVTDPEEPLPRNHPIRNCPNAILTPHVAAANLEVRHGIATSVIDDLERFFNGQPVHHQVTASMLERMT